MRLLQLDEDGRNFSLVEFPGSDKTPPYAILSHTWGPPQQEVTYDDLRNGANIEKAGYSKLTYCAAQAAKDDLRYFWVDTCCINKESTAELTEAITSMFRWYHNSARCYVYMTDVHKKHPLDLSWEPLLKESRWFRRGWTLQELLAPRIVMFYSKEWELLGDKVGLEQQIHDITHLPKLAIRGSPLEDFDIDDRISWMDGRKTTREEDMAYSLIGILNVSMPAIYGEGKEHAFKRLERETRDTSSDSRALLLLEHRQKLLKLLHFAQIDARQQTIRSARSETCTWLLRDPQYISWLDQGQVTNHHGFLWIKGKPGTGKSTLMKFALAQACESAAQRAVLSFFFNARGVDLERNTMGMYRSLLFQLLDPLPHLQSAFDCINTSSVSIVGEKFKWTIDSLKQVLRRAIMLLKDQRVVCYIDALDECDDEQVRDMIRFFEGIGDCISSACVDFRICFSSRHYPHITIRYGVSLILEGQEGHRSDITDYLQSELEIGYNAIAEEIRQEVQRKASGIFMWVVLVVEILNKEYNHGRIHALRRKLQEIPNDLHDLFRDMLLRDPNDQEELIACIQWVLFAPRPLSPAELYFAVLTATDPEALFVWDQSPTNQDAAERFVLHSSRGLAEITKAIHPEDRQTQFIHESVRDFLLKGDGLSKLWPDLRNNFAGRSHDRLKQCCVEYFNKDAIARFNVVPVPSKSAAKLARNKVPFLPYSLRWVFHHAKEAEKCGIEQNEFFRAFPMRDWEELHNVIVPSNYMNREFEEVGCCGGEVDKDAAAVAAAVAAKNAAKSGPGSEEVRGGEDEIDDLSGGDGEKTATAGEIGDEGDAEDDDEFEKRFRETERALQERSGRLSKKLAEEDGSGKQKKRQSHLEDMTPNLQIVDEKGDEAGKVKDRIVAPPVN